MLTYDPTGLEGGYRCVEFLKEKGIEISQKLGAKLIYLSEHNIQLTLAALEDCSPKSDEEKFLLSIKNDSLPTTPEKKSELKNKISEAGFNYCEEDGILKILSDVEEPEIVEKNEYLPVTAISASNLIQQRSISGNSLLNDRKYIETLAFNFLDSEDEEVICENMKKLVRISKMSDQSPKNIFIEAIEKGNKNVWIKTSEVIKELCDRPFGENLMTFLNNLSDDENISNLLFRMCRNSDNDLRTSVLLALIPNITVEEKSLEIILKNKEDLIELLSRDIYSCSKMVKIIPEISREEDPLKVKEFRFLLKDLNKIAPIAKIIEKEIDSGLSDRDTTNMLWFLSAMDGLSSFEKTKYSKLASKTIDIEEKSMYMFETLKTVLKNFLPESLEAIENLADDFPKMTQDTKSEIITIWNEIYGKNEEILPESIANNLKLEINGKDDTITKQILSSNIIDKISKPFEIKNSEKLLKNAIEIFSADKTGLLKKSMPTRVSELIENSCEMLIEMISKSDSIPSTDDLEFLSSLYITELKKGKKFEQNIPMIMRKLSKRGSNAILSEAEIVHKSGGPKDRAEELIKSAEDLRNIDKFKVVFPLLHLIDENYSDELITKILDKIEEYTSEEIETIIDESLKEFKEFVPKGTDKILRLFMRKNAMRITMPSMNMKFSLDEETINSSVYLQRYEKEKWSWENCGQSLFVSEAILENKNADQQIKKLASSVILYVLRHWSIESRKFLLNHNLVFRIIKMCAELQDKKNDLEIQSLISELAPILKKYISNAKDDEYKYNDDFIITKELLKI